jgi:hypothetical protein
VFLYEAVRPPWASKTKKLEMPIVIVPVPEKKDGK